MQSSPGINIRSSLIFKKCKRPTICFKFIRAHYVCWWHWKIKLQKIWAYYLDLNHTKLKMSLIVILQLHIYLHILRKRSLGEYLDIKPEKKNNSEQKHAIRITFCNNYWELLRSINWKRNRKYLQFQDTSKKSCYNHITNCLVFENHGNLLWKMKS